MFKSHLLTTFRHLFRHKVRSLFTVLGLAVGMAASISIWQYIAFESSYDNFHKGGDSIYRALFTDYVNGEKIASSPRFGYGLGPALLEDLPEIKTYVRTHGMGGDQAVISYEESAGNVVKFQERGLLFVDSTFLDVFSFRCVDGNALTALDNPGSIVLTESAADKYFGHDINPVGKVLRVLTSYWTAGDYEVTAVIKDVPANSHFEFDFLIPIQDLLRIEAYRQPRAEWDWVNFITYVQMHAGTRIEDVNAKTDALLTKYTGPNEPGTFVFTFQPLRHLHLDGRNGAPFDSLGFYGLISILILIIAWANYINIVTAQAIERARESAIKKVIGAGKGQLAMQYLLDSGVIGLSSGLLAIGLTMALLPILQDITGKQLESDFCNARMWILAAVMITTGCVASGGYVTFVLSTFKVANVMRGDLTHKGHRFPIRKSLVVFQFAISLVLVTITYAVFRQIGYMQNKAKGMAMENMLIIDGPKILREGDSGLRLLSFKNELLKCAFVSKVATSGSVPGGGFSLVTGIQKVGETKPYGEIPTGYIVRSDADFPETYGLQLIAGRPWVQDGPHPSGVLINEEALKVFALGDAHNALQKKLIIGGEDTVSITGVFKNIHWNALQTPHVPMLFQGEPIAGQHFSVRIGGDVNTAVNTVEELYKKYFPESPVNFYFLDDAFNRQYQEEQQFGRIIGAFAALAVALACMGLWGLTAFDISKRLKEIGVRKIFGASFKNILQLLAWRHIKLMIMASSIVIPLIWYATDQWLNNFTFRISVSWDIFAFPLLALLLISLITISLQVVKGAMVNPVDNLRSQE